MKHVHIHEKHSNEKKMNKKWPYVQEYQFNPPSPKKKKTHQKTKKTQKLRHSILIFSDPKSIGLL